MSGAHRGTVRPWGRWLASASLAVVVAGSWGNVAEAQIVVQQGAFSCGSSASSDGVYRLGSTIAECGVGVSTGNDHLWSLGFWVLAGRVGAGPGGATPSITDFLLAPARPNPFTQSTRLHYELPRAGNVRLSIYDPTGRLLRVLVDREESAGVREVEWDGADAQGRSAPPGVYLYRVEARGFRDARKLIKF